MNTDRLPARPAQRWLPTARTVGLSGLLATVVVAVLVAVGIVSALFAAPAAAADNSLSSSTPQANSTVAVSPASLTLVFAAPVGVSPQVDMTCGDPGQVISLAKPALLADGVTVSVQLSAAAPKGKCTVSWGVTDTNLQPAGSGSFTFSITNDTVVTTSTVPPTTLAGGVTTGTGVVTSSTVAPTTSPGRTGGSGSSTSTTTHHSGNGPVALFRLLSNLGLAIVLGSLVVIAIAWPEGVEYILTVRFLRYAWGLALIGSALFAGALTASQTGDGLGASMMPTAWSHLVHTTSGKAAILRLVFVVASAYVIMRPERAIDPSTQLAALAPPALAVVTIAFSRDQFGLADFAVGTVHALAMAVWVGGLVLLTRVVLAGPGDEDLVHAVRGFSRISTPALAATVLTGLIEMFRLDRGQLGTSHGLVLVMKALVVVAMVFVGVAARQFINQRVTRATTMTAPLAQRLRRALGIEASLGVVVLLLTSWLLALSPPGLAAGAGPSLQLGPAHRFQNTALNTDVTLQFSERQGLNDVRIQVALPAGGLSGLAIDFFPPVGSTVAGMTIEPIPLTGAGVAVLKKDTGFSLNATGTWTVVVRVGQNEVARQDVFVGTGGTPVGSTNPPNSGTSPSTTAPVTGAT